MHISRCRVSLRRVVVSISCIARLSIRDSRGNLWRESLFERSKYHVQINSVCVVDRDRFRVVDSGPVRWPGQSRLCLRRRMRNVCMHNHFMLCSGKHGT